MMTINHVSPNPILKCALLLCSRCDAAAGFFGPRQPADVFGRRWFRPQEQLERVFAAGSSARRHPLQGLQRGEFLCVILLKWQNVYFCSNKRTLTKVNANPRSCKSLNWIYRL